MTLLNRAVLWHRLKTACYAISSIVLISWVTDALNESLMFKPVLRYFYPQAVENYQHPFTDHPSLMIWLLPLLAALLLMFATSTLAVHHFKRRHYYRLSQAMPHPELTHWVTVATADPDRITAMSDTARPRPQTLHVLYRQADELKPLQAAMSTTGIQLCTHALPDTQDIHRLYQRVGQIFKAIRHAAGTGQHIGLCLSDLPPELASAATLACLENEITLCYRDAKQQWHAHQVTCEVGA